MSGSGSLGNIFQLQTVEKKSPFDIDKLADKFRQQNTGWSIPEAFLGLLYVTASVDGDFGAQEVEAIRAVVSRSRAMGAVSPQDLAKADLVVRDRLKTRPNALQEACATLPADMRLSVFAHCVDIILADGQLLKTEADFTHKLAASLEIDMDAAKRVMEVLLLKAQY